jgi:hypothetical protein
VKVRRRLIVLGSATAALLVALPMASASAAHNISAIAKTCVNQAGNSPYDGVEVALVGLGSDAPRNALVAARARVSTAAACNRTNGIHVLRITINRVSLLTPSSVLTHSGAKGGGTFVTLDSPGVRANCTTNYRVGVRFSVRYADQSLASGFANGPFWRKPC